MSKSRPVVSSSGTPVTSSSRERSRTIAFVSVENGPHCHGRERVNVRLLVSIW